MPDYRLARQRHVGEMLDKFKKANLLTWRWNYDEETDKAEYFVKVPGSKEQKLDTRRAEELVQTLCDERGIRWKAVPHPGGMEQCRRVQAWIDGKT
jgi:hypothetical protein